MSERSPGVDETLARVTELARQALAAQTTLAKQSIELGRATLAGDVDRSTASRAYLDALSREGAAYWREVGALGLDYVSEVMALGSRAAARVMGEASSAAARSHRAPGRAGATPMASEEPPTPQPETPTGPRRAEVTLKGVVGQTAQATITVRNNHPRARRVELTASPLRDASGAEVGVVLRVDPDHVTIPAGEEHVVRLEAELDPGHAQVGDRYEGVVEVSGGDEARLEVSVEVVA